MDRFEKLIEEFVSDNAEQFNRSMVVKLMELAFRLGMNCGLVEALRPAEKKTR
jgi:hypothetical protein